MYVDLVMLLNFVVDWLLLMGTNRICGFQDGRRRSLMAALFGGVYGGLCIVPRLVFLGGFLFRLLSLLLMGAIAFGLNLSALRRTVVFALLSMALGGIALGTRANHPVALVVMAIVMLLLCNVGFKKGIGMKYIVPVEFRHKGKLFRISALRDTGNNLRDPVTGRAVLIVGAQIAKQMLGTTQMQLRQPVDTIVALNTPGLRLIPYSTIGESGRFLLAMRIQDVRIGSWRGNSLVAFSPEYLGLEGYQALTGGIGNDVV